MKKKCPHCGFEQELLDNPGIAAAPCANCGMNVPFRLWGVDPACRECEEAQDGEGGEPKDGEEI